MHTSVPGITSALATCFVLFELLTHSVTPLAAQTTGTISGRVVDAATGAPLAGAEILIEQSGRSVPSSEDGRFVLAGVPTGVYTVRVELLSYRTLRVEQVEVRSRRRKSLELELEAAAIELDPLVVEAERVPLIEPEVSETHHVLLGRELRQLPVDDVAEAVALAPGVTEGHFRGGRIGQETYVVDGLAVKNQLEASSQGLGLEFSPTSLQEIEVITGGFGAEYGSAISGVVSYATRKGDPYRWGARASALTDLWATQDLSKGFSELSISAGGPLSFLGAGTTLFADLFFQGRIDSDPRARGLTCLRPDQVEPELALEIEQLQNDPTTAHLYCPFSRSMIPNQEGDKFIGFLRLDRPLSRSSTLTASLLRNRVQRQLYTPEFKYNLDYQLGQSLTGTLVNLSFDWSVDAEGKAFHLTARGAAMRLERELGVLDLDQFDDRFKIAGFGFSDFDFLGADFVRLPIDEQIRSGNPVPGYLPPGGSTGSPFGPAAEGIFFTEGTPGIASWNRSDFIGGDFVGEYLSAKGHSLRAGASGRFYEIETYERPFSYFSGSTINFARFYPNTVAGFATLEVRTAEIFTATFGVRVESFKSGLSFDLDRANFLSPTIDTDAKVAVTPRIGFAGAFRNSGGQSAFRFNFARVAQPPDFRFFLDTTIGDSQRTDIRNQGNPNLSYEEGRVFEIGFSHLAGDAVGLSISAFRKELTQLVTGNLPISGLAPGQFSTGDRGTVTGVEISVRGRWTGLQLSGGYALQEATGITSGALDTDVDTAVQVTEFPLAFDRRHTADFVVLGGRAAGWDGTGWGVSLAASVRSGFPLDRLASEVTRLPWTSLIRLGVSRELGDFLCRGCGARIIAEGRNIFGRDNVIALRRDTGELGPPSEVVLGAADDIPVTQEPIPLESSLYSPATDLDRDGMITAEELRRVRVAAALDRNDPSLFYGEAFQIRLGVELEF